MCYEVLIYAVDDVINFKIYFHQPLKQWLTGGKRWEDENTKSEYLENEKSFLDDSF